MVRGVGMVRFIPRMRMPRMGRVVAGAAGLVGLAACSSFSLRMEGGRDGRWTVNGREITKADGTVDENDDGDVVVTVAGECNDTSDAKARTDLYVLKYTCSETGERFDAYWTSAKAGLCISGRFFSKLKGSCD